MLTYYLSLHNNIRSYNVQSNIIFRIIIGFLQCLEKQLMHEDTGQLLSNH